MLTVYDTAGNEWPADTQYALCYANGIYANVAYVRQHFPKASVLTIDVTGSGTADMVDVESGDATPAVAAIGLTTGRYKTAYASLSTAAEIGTLMDQPWQWFAADPTGVPHYPVAARNSTVVGSQNAWAELGQTQGRNIDISIATESLFGVTPPPPPVAPPEELNMLASTPSGNGYWIVHPDGSIWAFGDAVYHGGCNPGAPVAGGAFAPGETAITIAGHPTGQGYWIYSSHGHVYAFGACAYHGGA